MKNMKKIITLVLILGLINTQTGCAGKTTKISAPMDQIKFDKNYKYTVKMKNGQQTQRLNGEQIQVSEKQLKLSQNSNTKLIPSEKINRIDGQSVSKSGSNALLGMGIGAGVLGGITFGLAQEGKCIDDGNTGNDACLNDKGMIIVSAIGAGLGALFGLGIGALIPKYDKVQITPIVSPTTSGVDAGVNVGVKF